MSNGGRPKDLATSDVIDNALKKVRITSAPGTDVLTKVGTSERPIYVAGQGSLTEMAEGHREQVEEERRDSVVTKVTEPDLAPIPRPPEEEEPVPSSDVSLLDKTQEEIQEEMQTVEEPRDDGAFAWYPKFHASIDKGQADEISPAVITAIVQARSGGDEEYIYGDAYGLFGMGASERTYVQQVLRETGELEPDEVMSVKEYNDWRAEPENQINFYAPMIHGFVLRGVEAGIKGRDLAEMVGKQVELPGSRVLPDGAYAKGYDTVTATAQQIVNEEFPDGVPDKVRVEAGVLSQDALREAGLKVPTRQVELWESEYAGDVTPRMVTTAEGEPFEAGRSREWYEKYLLDPVSRVFRPVKQWAGLMYNSSPQGKAAIELAGAGADRLAALVVTSITAASGSAGAPFYAVAGFAKTDTSKSDSLWHSLGMRSAGAFEAVKRRWERVGDHWAPQFVNKEEDQSGWEWTVEKWNELKDHVPDEGSGQDWFQTDWSMPLGWKEFKRVFIPGTQGWSEEKLDEEWDKARDWSYTFMFDPDAERAYLKDKAQVLAEVNARRAMDGLEPRSLSYHETDELKFRHEDPSIEMVGEVIGDLTWLFPGRLIKAAGSLLSVSPVARGVKTAALKLPIVKILVTEHVGSQAVKGGVRGATPIIDTYNAFIKFCNDLLPGSDNAVRDFLSAQQSVINPKTGRQLSELDSGGVIEAMQLLLRRGLIVDPRTNEIINLFEIADVTDVLELPDLVTKLWARLGTNPDSPIWTSVPHKSGWFSRPKLNLIARNTEKVLGPRATALGRSLPKRLENLYKIYKYRFWDHAAGQAGDEAEGILKVLVELSEKAKNQVGDGWRELDDAAKSDHIFGLLKDDIGKEFKMKFGYAQGGKIYDTIEASPTYRQLINAETINPFLMAGPRFFRTLWIESNLSARPGFTARNVVDSTFRALIAGGGGILRRPLDKIMATTPLPDEILAGLSRGIGTGASAKILKEQRRLPKPWSPKDWWSGIRQVTKRVQQESAEPGAIAKFPWPIGRWGWGSKWRGTWKTPWGDMNLTYATMVNVMQDWNEAFEVMLRIRLFDKFYHNLYDDIFKWWRKGVLNNPNLSRGARQKLKEMLDNLPDKDAEAAQVIAQFVESTSADLQIALIPKRVSTIINSLRVADDHGVRTGQQMISEIANDLYKVYKKKKQLTFDDVDEVFAKHEAKLKKDMQDALDNIRGDDYPKNNDNDLGGFDSDGDDPAPDLGGMGARGESKESKNASKTKNPAVDSEAEGRRTTIPNDEAGNASNADPELVNKAAEELNKPWSTKEPPTGLPVFISRTTHTPYVASAWEKITLANEKIKVLLQRGSLEYQAWRQINAHVNTMHQWLKLFPGEFAHRPSKAYLHRSGHGFMAPDATYRTGARDINSTTTGRLRMKDILAQINERLANIYNNIEDPAQQLDELRRLSNFGGFLDAIGAKWDAIGKAQYNAYKDPESFNKAILALEKKLEGTRHTIGKLTMLDLSFPRGGDAINGVWKLKWEYDPLAKKIYGETGNSFKIPTGNEEHSYYLDELDLTALQNGFTDATDKSGVLYHQNTVKGAGQIDFMKLGDNWLDPDEYSNLTGGRNYIKPDDMDVADVWNKEMLLEEDQAREATMQASRKIADEEVGANAVDTATKASRASGRRYTEMSLAGFKSNMDRKDSLEELHQIHKDIIGASGGNASKTKTLSNTDKLKVEYLNNRINVLENLKNERNIDAAAQLHLLDTKKLRLTESLNALENMTELVAISKTDPEMLDSVALVEWNKKLVPKMTVSQYAEKTVHSESLSRPIYRDKYADKVNSVFAIEAHEVVVAEDGVRTYKMVENYIDEVNRALKLVRRPELDFVARSFGIPLEPTMQKADFRKKILAWLDFQRQIEIWELEQTDYLFRHIDSLEGIDDWLLEKYKAIFPKRDIDKEIAGASKTVAKDKYDVFPRDYREKVILDLVTLFNEGKVKGREFGVLTNYRDAIIRAARNGVELSDEVMKSAIHTEDLLVWKHDQQPTGISLRHMRIEDQDPAFHIFNKLWIPDHDVLNIQQALDAGYELTDLVFTSPNEIGNWFGILPNEDLFRSYVIVKDGNTYRVASKTVDMNKAPWDMTTGEFLVWWTGSPQTVLDNYGLQHPPQKLASANYRARLQMRVNSIDDTAMLSSANFTKDEQTFYNELHRSRRHVLEEAITGGHNPSNIFLKEYPDLLQLQAVLRHQGYILGLPLNNVRRVGVKGTAIRPTKEMVEAIPFLAKYRDEAGNATLKWRTLEEWLQIYNTTEPAGTKLKKLKRAGWGKHIWKDEFLGLEVKRSGGGRPTIKGVKELPKVIDLIRSINSVPINYQPDHSLQTIIKIIPKVETTQRKIQKAIRNLNNIKLQYSPVGDERKFIEEAISQFRQAQQDVQDVSMLLNDRVVREYPDVSIDLIRKKEQISRILPMIGEISPATVSVKGHGAGWNLAGDKRPWHELPRPEQLKVIKKFIKDRGASANAEYQDARLWALVEMLNGTGLRIDELNNLTWANIIEDADGYWHVSIKQKENVDAITITLLSEAQRALHNLKQRTLDGAGIQKIAADALDQYPLFLKKDRTKYNSSTLSKHIINSGGETNWGLNDDSIKEWIKNTRTPTGDLMLSARRSEYLWGSDQKFHAHDLRRNYAVQLFEINGGDAELTQDMLGHKGLLTTVLFYLRRGGVSDNRLQDYLVRSASGTSDQLLADFQQMVGTNAAQDASEAVKKEISKRFSARAYQKIKALEPINPITDADFDATVKRVQKSLEYFFDYEHAPGKTQAGKKFKETWQDFIDLIHGDNKVEHLAEQFYREVARRTGGELNDIAVGQKLIYQAGLRRVGLDDLMVGTATGSKKVGVGHQDMLIEYLDELELMVDPVIGGKTVSYLDAPNVDNISGWQLTDKNGQVLEFSPLYLTREAALRDQYYYGMTKGIAPEMGIKEVELGGSDAWEEVLPNYYQQWRRLQWQHHQDDILAHKSYKNISKNIELWERDAPGQYRKGLREFHPLINDDAPLGYRKFVADMRRRGMTIADLEANTPIYMNIADEDLKDVINAGKEHAAHWNRQIQTGESLGTKNNHPPVEMGLNPKYNKPRQYIVVGPRHAYEMIPEEDYIAYVMDVPKGVTERINTELTVPAHYDATNKVIEFQSESLQYNPTVRNHEVGHALVHVNFGPYNPGMKLKDLDKGSVFYDYAKVFYKDQFDDNMHQPISKFLNEERGDYFWKQLELWLTDPGRELDDAGDIVSVFKKHFGDLHKNKQSIRRTPASYDPGIHGLNYEGVKVKYNKKPYVLTNNVHFYEPEDFTMSLSRMSAGWNMNPVYGNPIVLSKGRYQYNAQYVVVDLSQLKPQYNVIEDPSRWAKERFTLSPNKEFEPRLLREFALDPEESASSIRMTAEHYVPEYALNTNRDALEGILIDRYGNVLNNHRDVLVHQYWKISEDAYKSRQYQDELISRHDLFGLQLKDTGYGSVIQGAEEFDNPVLVRMIVDPLDEASIQDLIDIVNPRKLAPPSEGVLKNIIARETKLIESALDEGYLPGLTKEDQVITFDDFTSYLAGHQDSVGAKEFIQPGAWRKSPQFVDSIWRTMAVVLFPEELADDAIRLAEWRQLAPDNRVANLLDIISDEFGWLLKFKKDHPNLYHDYIVDDSGLGLLYDIKEASQILQAAKLLMPDVDIRHSINVLLQKEGEVATGAVRRLIRDETQPESIISNNAELLARHTAEYARYAGNNLDVLSQQLKQLFDAQALHTKPELRRSLEDIIQNAIETAEEQIKTRPNPTHARGATASAIASTNHAQAVSSGLETSVKSNRVRLEEYVKEILDAEKLTPEQLRYVALMHGIVPESLQALSSASADALQDIARRVKNIAKDSDQAKKTFGERTTGQVAAFWEQKIEDLPEQIHKEWDDQIVAIINNHGPQKEVSGTVDILRYETVAAGDLGGANKFAVENAPKEDIEIAFANWLSKGAEEARLSLTDLEKNIYSQAQTFLDAAREDLLDFLVHGGEGINVTAPPYEQLRMLWEALDVHLLGGGYTGAPIATGFEEAPMAVWRVSGAGKGAPMKMEYTGYGKELRDKIIKLYLDNQDYATTKIFKPLPQEVLEGLADQIADWQYLYHNGSMQIGVGRKIPEANPLLKDVLWQYGYNASKDEFPKKVTGQHAVADSIGMWLDIITKPKNQGGMAIPLGGDNIWDLVRLVAKRDVFGKLPEALEPKLVERLNFYHYANVLEHTEISSTGIVSPSLRQLAKTKAKNKAGDIIEGTNLLVQLTGSKYASPEDVRSVINKQLAFAHSELWDAMSERGIPEQARVISAQPMQIASLDDPVPSHLIDGINNTVDWGLLSEEKAKSWYEDAINYKSTSNYVDEPFAYHPNQGQNPLSNNEAAEQELLYIQAEMKKALAEWRTHLIGPDGNLDKPIKLGIEEEEKILEELQEAWWGAGGLLDQRRAIKHTAMYGTKEPSQLSKVLTPELPQSDLEKAVDTYVDRSIQEFKLGTDPHDMELWQSSYGPGSDEWNRMKANLADHFDDLTKGVDLEDQPAEVVMSQRFDKHVEQVTQDPMKWMDFRTLKPTIAAQEGLASLEGALDRLTPEDLALLAPGYYNWGFDVPFVRDKVVLGATKPSRVHGAIKTVGDAMVDYQTNTNLDQMMKTIFPFWIFPTRSIKFWLGELAARPKILSTWSQIQGMSERMAHDVGATDTRGHQLPRFRGNVNLTGTNWWWNPTAPLSFTQALPGARNVYGLADSEAPIFKRLATYLYAFGPAAGFHLAPWISIPMHRMGWLDENEFPQRSLLGQVDLIPEWHQRATLKKVQDSLWYSIRPDATWTPEVSWKDFLVERQVLTNLEREIEPMHELDKQKKVKEAEMAILLRTGERWSMARQELEQTDYFARIVGYLSGMYGKKFNKGEAALYEARDEVGRLRRQISLDANYEEFYKDYRYNTADGLTYGLYKDISWVTDENGKQLYGQARWDEVSKNIAYQQQISAKIAREGANRRMLEIRLSELPIGSPWEAKEEIYQDYETIQKSILKAFPDVVYEWGPYNKNDETIREHVVDKWMKIVGEGRPFNWNREEQDWTQFQNSIVEWEDDIPNIAKLNIDRLFMELAGEKLFEPLKDYEGQPLHQKDEAGNVLLDAKGEPVPETIFESVLGKRIDVKKALLAMATSAEWNQWDIESDSLDDALYRVWLDNYAGGYYDFIDAGGPNEAEGSEREQMDRRWIEKYPGGPNTVELTGWIRNIYGDKWSDEQIALHRYGSGVATREERSEMQVTARQKAANEVYKWYGWVGPRGAKSKFYDTLEKIDERDGTEWTEVLGDFLDPSRKRTSSAQGLYTYWSDEFWTDFYNAMSEVALVLDLQAPTDQELEEWVLAEQLDDQFNRWRELDVGPNWDGLNALYYNKTRSEQLEWRKENPDLFARLQKGWTMKDAWGEQHPAWQKFFDPDVYHGVESARSSISGYSGVGATVTFGGENWRHSFAPSAALDSYKGVSINKIIKSLGRPQTPGQWPTLEVSQLALEELLAGKVSDTTEEYLKKLHQRVASYSPYETFLKQLRELARSVLGDITKEEDDWIWNREGASTDTVSPEMPVTPGGREDRFTLQR